MFEYISNFTRPFSQFKRPSTLSFRCLVEAVLLPFPGTVLKRGDRRPIWTGVSPYGRVSATSSATRPGKNRRKSTRTPVAAVHAAVTTKSRTIECKIWHVRFYKILLSKRLSYTARKGASYPIIPSVDHYVTVSTHCVYARTIRKRAGARHNTPLITIVCLKNDV